MKYKQINTNKIYHTVVHAHAVNVYAANKYIQKISAQNKCELLISLAITSEFKSRKSNFKTFIKIYK